MPIACTSGPRGRISVMALCALLAVMAAATLRAQPGAPSPGRSSRVAVVDLRKVLDGLDERKDGTARIEQMAAGFTKSLDEINRRRDNYDKDLTQMKGKENTPEFKKLWQERLELIATGETRQRVLGRQLEEEQGLMLRDLFRKMTGAVQTIAERESWDIVLRDDREEIPDQIPDGSGGNRAITGKDVRRFVDSVNILSVAPGADITQAVVTQLNNDYRAGRK